MVKRPTAHPIPSLVIDKVQLDWAARQFREIVDAIRNLQNQMEQVVFAGHGWMNRATPLPLPLDQTWRRLIFETSGAEVNTDFSPSTGEFDFLVRGNWMITATLSFSFTETNASRRIAVRLIRTDTNAVLVSGFIGVSRNIDVVQQTVSLLIDATGIIGTQGVKLALDAKADTGDVFVATSFERGNIILNNVGAVVE